VKRIRDEKLSLTAAGCETPYTAFQGEMRRHSVSTVRRGSGRRGVSEESSILGEDRGHKPDVKVGVVDLRGGFHFRVGREDLVRTIAGAFAVAAFGIGGFNLRSMATTASIFSLL
jgi:hypothetical protein